MDVSYFGIIWLKYSGSFNIVIIFVGVVRIVYIELKHFILLLLLLAGALIGCVCSLYHLLLE